MSGDLLLREDRDAVAHLTLNRPERLNALSRALLSELQEALDAIGKDGAVRVVVLAGSGRAFSAGHDLAEIRGLSAGGLRELFDTCSLAMIAVRRIPQPVIAKVHGIATAAG